VKDAAAVLDGRPDGNELRQVSAPVVTAHLQPDADDPVGAELVGLLLHAGHRQLARGVHRLREGVELGVANPRSLEPEVVDRRADYQPDRIKTNVLDQEEVLAFARRGPRLALDTSAGVVAFDQRMRAVDADADDADGSQLRRLATHPVDSDTAVWISRPNGSSSRLARPADDSRP
jgi:hypothetical protein